MRVSAQSLQEINDNIQIAVENGRYLTLKTHRMTETVENHLQYSLESILKKTEQERLIHTLYTILKELVINGCKANQKRIFFEEQNLDILSAEDYKTGNDKYKETFSEKMAYEYGLKARTHGFYVLVDFIFDQNGLTIEVINNTAIATQEETAMREKLKRAMSYNDIAEFYMDQAMQGDNEGAGLGLALIIILLKGEGIDPKLFRIHIENDLTTARLEIPFNEDFKSKRDQ